MKKNVWCHGELGIFKTDSVIPEGAKKIKGDGEKYIVAPSETTGNHHCVQEKEGVELYEKEGVMYLKADVAVDVFCVLPERHDTITLEPGIYEIEPAKEYDYLSQEIRNVKD